MVGIVISNVLSENTTKYKEKVRTKFAKTAISGIFPAFSPGKKFFSKIGLGYVMSIGNTHLCAKNWKKTNDEISRKCQKTDFKKYFSKIGLGHILDIGILHQCARFHEKIYSTAREFQEIPFFRRKSAVPAKIPATKISLIDE